MAIRVDSDDVEGPDGPGWASPVTGASVVAVHGPATPPALAEEVTVVATGGGAWVDLLGQGDRPGGGGDPSARRRQGRPSGPQVTGVARRARPRSPRRSPAT